MNLDRAVERAQSVSGEKTAARLYNDIEHELALGGGGSEESYEGGEQALKVLEERYPGVESRARDIHEPPKLSHRANATLRRGDHPLEARPRREQQIRRRSQGGTRARVAQATTIHARPRRSSSSSGVGRRFAQTGVPGAYESGVQLTMKTIGWIAGMSFLYLVLQPRGATAVSDTFGGLTKAFSAFASPKNTLLGAQGNASAAAAAGPGTARSPALYGTHSALGGAFSSVDQELANLAAQTAALAKRAPNGASKPGLKASTPVRVGAQP